jgi:hypothetical protein
VIHILLVIAIVVILIRVIQGRRVVRGFDATVRRAERRGCWRFRFFIDQSVASTAGIRAFEQLRALPSAVKPLGRMDYPSGTELFVLEGRSPISVVGSRAVRGSGYHRVPHIHL